MKNYFVSVNYYISNSSTPIDCDSTLITDCEDCLAAWRDATNTFGNCVKNNCFSKFVITEFKEIC